MNTTLMLYIGQLVLLTLLGGGAIVLSRRLQSRWPLALLPCGILAVLLLRMGGRLFSPLLLVLAVAVALAAVAWDTPLVRAESARRRGQLAEALETYATAGRESGVRAIITGALPTWPLRDLVLKTADLLLALQGSAAAALRVGVPAAIAARLVEETRTAQTALWQAVERLALVGQQGLAPEVLRPLLEREEDKIARLYEAGLSARDGLAALTLAPLAGEDLERAENRLRILGQAALGVRG